MNCPLCLSHDVIPFFERTDVRYGKRDYNKCLICRLIFLSPEFHFNLAQEKARYDTHENSPQDSGYVSFLKKLADPLCQKIKPGDRGLDFGCGPGPTMSVILNERGFQVENYDPIYFPKKALLQESYDFITCTETIEHFYQPRKEFELLSRRLKPGGILGIMTEILHDETQFPTWWYPNDPTHVTFYQKETFEWIAHWQRRSVEFPVKNIIFLMQVQGQSSITL